MGMRKLLIADYNEEFRLAMTETLHPHFQIFCCDNGKTALELLNREKPEVLLLDLMLPEIDGITLLHRAAAQGLHPAVMVVTRYESEYVLETVKELNISYIMRKPCDISAVTERLLDVGRVLPPPAAKPDPTEYVEGRLKEFWFPVKRKGYSRLLASILVKSKDLDMNITKHVYPEAAKLCGAESQNMERPIRLLLEHTWVHGNQALWKTCFPGHTKRPTNDEFIDLLAREVRRIQE